MPQGTRDARLTYDDYLLFPDDGLRHEIIDGEHYVTPSPNMRHQALAGRLHFEIELFVRAHAGLGRVFFAPVDVLFTKWDVVEPDLLFVAADQDDILTDKNVQGAPALVAPVVRSRWCARILDRGPRPERRAGLPPPERRIVSIRRAPERQ
jgi:Uma2 family endonuclease